MSAEQITRSNCVAQALAEYRRRHGAWHAAGRHPGAEPYLLVRPSRCPGGIVHMLVGQLDPATGQVQVASFKPVAPAPRAWWHPPLRFLGRWVLGD